MSAEVFEVETGKVHAFEAEVAAATVVGDFGQNGRLNERSQPIHARRVLRPGAIILANLDIDGPIPNPRPEDMTAVLDANQPSPRPNDGDLALLGIRAPTAPKLSKRTYLRVSANEAKMVRIFQREHGAAPKLALGGKVSRLDLPESCNPRLDLYVEATTLPGDPTIGWKPGKPTPGKPIYPAASPADARVGQPLHAERAPGEIWLEVVHEDMEGTSKSGSDVGLLTVAPFLLIPNTRPVERLYLVYNPKLTHAFVYDILEACQSIWPNQIDLSPDTSAPIRATTAQPEGPVWVIDASKHQDIWLQDAMEVGCCQAPHATMHMVLRCARPGQPLDRSVRKQIPGPGVGLFEAIARNLASSKSANESVNFGGNIEVSPPILTATLPLAADTRSPAIPAHPVAKLGKIVLGDSKLRPVDKNLREFLFAQSVQPVLPLDVSWLKVGHVDEFMGCVCDQRGKLKVLWASPMAMEYLLQEAISMNPTGFHRGLLTELEIAADLETTGEEDTTRHQYAEVTVEEMLKQSRRFNRALKSHVLDGLRARVQHGLAVALADFIPIPVFFESVSSISDIGKKGQKGDEQKNRTSARTMGCVNLQVVDGHLLVPRPHGPRLSAPLARQAISAALSKLTLADAPAVQLPNNDGFWFWCRPGMSMDHVATVFCQVDRKRLVEHLRAAHQDELDPAMEKELRRLAPKQPDVRSYLENRLASPSIKEAVQKSRAEILSHPRNQKLPLAPGESTFSTWHRLWIPEATVDIVEGFIASVLAPLGKQVHFVDCWEFHRRMGEVHCGTNTMRRPPDVKWWEHYDPSVNTRYKV